MASYRMSRFLAWYLPSANMRLRRIGSRYGTCSGTREQRREG